MSEASGVREENLHVSLNITKEMDQSEDLSRLSPSELADYHLAVTAMQLNGKEVYLSDIAREEAERTIHVTQHDLLVASCDALTKEMLPGNWGGTLTYDTESIIEMMDSEIAQCTKKYEKYIPQKATKSKTSRVDEPASEFDKVIYAVIVQELTKKNLFLPTGFPPSLERQS